MKLVEDARHWWRWHSTYVFALIGILPEVWLQSPDLRALVPASVLAHIAPFVGALGLLLRIRKQVIDARDKDQ